MGKPELSLPWQLNANESYVPVFHEGRVIGYLKSDYAKQVVSSLNHVEKLHKALHMACYDLVARMGRGSGDVGDLMQQYLTKLELPKSGTGAIALLLRDRQAELDLTDDEFAKFCDTFRLSRIELKTIYSGEEIEYGQLAPLSRILGIPTDELIEVWKGE
ncbi:hypothetical protein K9N68_24205 [Kovacikia minuta CCNUW1]|uniref:hypothetical protein n=1 Tax=Kovacikia minuta TaxID=2931930 RepID=UPI001CCA819C|nr:hypothetical protein [Kovacikia minuta]UBF24747.1 hypothetical protein K9N68_24205 [Kovacikia minuta CCNUW1]